MKKFIEEYNQKINQLKPKITEEDIKKIENIKMLKAKLALECEL